MPALHPNFSSVGRLMRSAKAGFTLVELLVAAAASLILSGVALMGLVTFQQMSQQMDERLVQEAELRRALHLIATDIQEGKRIQAGAPELPGYNGLFQIILPDKDESKIGYYSRARGTRVWAGPQIIYRRDSREAVTYALIDQIANVEEIGANPSQLCPKLGTSEPIVGEKAGVVVWIDSQSTAKVCLLGHLAKSKVGATASIVASTRVAP
jgi:prepilin-type N-terminal cleavage/methylation domain-containing protein